jgi:hypothetical protein
MTAMAVAAVEAMAIIAGMAATAVGAGKQQAKQPVNPGRRFLLEEIFHCGRRAIDVSPAPDKRGVIRNQALS